MQRQMAKSLLGIILSIFIFTGLAASSTPMNQYRLEISEARQQKNSIQGTIVAAESGIPLKSGTVTIQDQTVDITDGAFSVAGLKTGKHTIVVQGPYREQKTASVTIVSGENTVSLPVDSLFSQQEIDMLARITAAEAEGESHEGQVAVASSILNRVQSRQYPNTIRGVVYQRESGRYQYSPVKDGRINLAPKSENYQAAYKALAGSDPSNGATGFFNPAKTRDQWVRSHPVTTRIGQHTFFSY